VTTLRTIPDFNQNSLRRPHTSSYGEGLSNVQRL